MRKPRARAPASAARLPTRKVEVPGDSSGGKTAGSPPVVVNTVQAGFAGPRPRLRDAVVTLRGLSFALLAVVALIILDTVASQRTALAAGDLLTWTPLALAGACLLLGLALPRARHDLLVIALVLPSMLTILHPDPRAWMMLGPLASCALVLALRLPPAARITLALPTLAVLLVVLMDAFAGSELQTLVTLVLAAAYVFGLGFAVPFESGWRRVPFATHAIVALTVALGLLGVLMAEVLSPDGQSLVGADRPTADALLGALVFAGYVAGVWFGWRHERARAFQLPTLDLAAVLPRAERNT